MAPRTKKATKKPAFKLEGDALFALTGRGKVSWFNLVEPDEEYNKFGGKFFPDDNTKMQQAIEDVLAETAAELDDAGIEATEVSPLKKDDDGNIYYSVGRSATKADGSDAVIKLRNKRGKVDEDILDGEELGNGSVVNIKVMFRGYYMPELETAGVTVPARYGVSMMPIEVQVIDHVIYEADDGFSDESDGDIDGDDGGFDNENSGSASNDGDDY